MENLQGMDPPAREIGGFWLKPRAMALAVALALGLSGCGGGGGANIRPTSPPPPAGDAGFTGGEIDVGGNDVTVLSDDIRGSIDLIKGGTGTLTLTGTDTYTGGTTINQGTLQIGNGGTTGSITGDVLDNGSLVFDRSDDMTFGGIVSGSGLLKQAGKGALILTGANTYTGGTTISSGILQLGNGGTTGSITGDVLDNGSLVFNRSDDVTFGNIISGKGSLVQAGNGTLILTGTNGYTGATQVNAGGLYVDGDQSAATGATIVANGTTLGGKGTLGGDVTLDDGAILAPGSRGAVGTLTINGDLSLSAGSMLEYNFGDLTNVKGNLTLDGSLNISVASDGKLGPGVYHLMNYGGTLVNNGLDLGHGPSGMLVQTGVTHQVNLVNTKGMTFSFWDGDAGPKGNNAINGGNGTWESGSSLSNNWTDATGAVNASFSDRSFAVFQAAPGTVTVDDGNGDVKAAGMQFASNGYVVQGDAIHLVGSMDDPAHSIIRVGDGTAAGTGYTATINSVLDGNSALVKTDTGMLALGGDNIYTGGTTISGGTLQIGNGGTTGSIIGNVTDNATLTFNRSDISSFDGIVSGTGSLTQAGIGTLILTGNNTYSGGTTVSDGILQIGNGGAAGWITGNIVNNKYVRFDRNDDVIFSGNISGTGSLLKDGAGTLILTGNNTYDSTNTYSNPTTITTGTLQIGNGGTTGSIIGDVTNNASLVFDRSDNVIFDGKVTGTGSLTQAGTGALILTGNNAYTRGITISRGTLQVGNGGTTGSIFGDVTDNGSLVFNYGDSPGLTHGYGGVINGTGKVVKSGQGVMVLTGDNTYTGGTTISGGTLQIGQLGGQIGATGSITGDVTDNGSLVFARGNDLTFGGVIRGNGSLEQAGTGTLTLTGTNTYTGGTTIRLGTLQIGNGGTTGSILGNVIDDTYYGSLIFNRSDDFSYGGVISGSGGVVKLGNGTLTISGINTFTGGLHVNNGALKLVSGAAIASQIVVGGAGQGANLEVDKGAMVSGSVLVEDQGILDNAGSLVTSTPGGTAVGGSDSVTITNHDGGLIQGDTSQPGLDIPAIFAGQNSTLTNGVGSIIRGYSGVSSQGTVNNAGGTITGMFSDGIEGSATLVNNTDGGQITSGTRAPPFNLLISSGVNTSASNAVVNNIGGSTIAGRGFGIHFFDGGTVTNDGGSLISGNVGVDIPSMSSATGLVNNIGGSTITGTRAGIVLVYGGTVINGPGSTIGATAPSTGDCSVALACSIYVPVYSANGSFGSNGTFNLTNAGNIVGDVQMDPTVINAITLIAGGYIHGALKIGANAQSTLALDGGAGTTQLYSNAVTGTTTFGGVLAKNGDGTWVIDNSDLQGVVDTSINLGSLRATQTLSGNVTVNATGNLDGVPGTAGNLINAGKVAVHGGDSTVGGNYAQSSTGTLAVSLGSKLDVVGTATLNGGTLEVTGADNGYVSNTHTNVLTAAGGLSGTFDQLVKDTGVVFTSSTINYDANSVWLDTTGLDVTTAAAGKGVNYTPASFGSAQRVQGAFEQLDDKIAAGKIASVSSDFVRAAGQFQQSPTLQAAQASLQSLSGQLHAASAAMTFQAIDASSRALSDRFDNLLDKGTGFGMWMHNLNVGGDMARAGFDSVGFQLNGWLVGSDRQIGRSGVAGYAFGQSRGQQRLDQGFDHDTSRSTEGMMYAGWLNGNWYTQGRVGFGRFQQDVSRQVLLGESAQGVRTQYNGSYDVAYGESGLHFGHGDSHVTPFVNVQYARIDRDGFAEQGAGGFGLRSNAQILDRWQAGLGVRASRHWDLQDDRSVDFNARAQWQRTLAARGEVFNASFVGLQQWQPLAGIGLSRYSGLFGVGLDAMLSAHTALKFSYDYEMGQRNNAQMLSARLNVAF